MSGKKKIKDKRREAENIYQLVLFIRNGDHLNNGNKECDNGKQIDIVPGFWLKFDPEIGSLVTPFLPPPYDATAIKELHKIVRNRKVPLGIWPEYPVELRGHAKTYAEALKRIKLLETENYVYTTDDGKQKSEATKRIFLDNAKFKVNPDEQDKLLKSAPKLPGKPLRKSKEISLDVTKESSTTDTVADEFEMTENLSPIHDSSSESRSHIKRSADGTKSSNSFESRRNRTTYSSSSETDDGILNIDTNKTHRHRNSGDSELENNELGAERRKVISRECTKLFEKHSLKDANSKSYGSTNKRNRSSTESNSSDFSSRSSSGLEQSLNVNPLTKKSRSDTTSLQATELFTKGQKTIVENSFTARESSRAKRNSSKKQGESEMDIQKHVFNPSVSEEEEANPCLLFQRLLKGLYVISLEQKALRKEMSHLSTALQSSNFNYPDVMANNLAEEYNLILPFGTLEEFQDFDNMIETNRLIRKDFKKTLGDLIDPKNILTRTLKNMLQKYIARSVILQYTAQKRTTEKNLVFKDTRFCKCIQEVLSVKYAKSEVIREKTFLQDLGTTITNAKDWEGFRALRGKK